MTAAVSLGSSLQSMGAAATQVTAGGLQAVTHQAATVASTAAANAATTLPATPGAASIATSQMADSVAVIEKPAKALATAAPRASFLVRTAGFLSKALPIVTIGASALAGAQIDNDKGVQALLTTKDGRGAVLGAVGGGLLLVPTPVTQLAAAGVLGAVAVNHFGGMDRLDTVHVPGTKPAPAQAPAG
jgi:hypothetical protein